MPRPLLSVRYWKEFRSSELIAQTVVAELVNKVGVERGPRFTALHALWCFHRAETKHIHHWSEARCRNNKWRVGERWRKKRMTVRLKEKPKLGEKHTPNVLYGRGPECRLFTLPTVNTHCGLWLLDTSTDWFQNSVKPTHRKNNGS